MSETTLSKKDFKSDQEVRWCPGCGDYAILNSVQGVMAELGLKRENTVIVSGIGCSSRFPYYMDTYGFHSIHGRAPAVATGVKLANPNLDVWLVTGDGDAMSIGGNHLIHMLRRNVGLKVLLFNNEIYGLTKGQYSPTSRQGLKTKASPYGSIDNPFNTLSLALGAGATFVARTIDSHRKHMEYILHEAAMHQGSAFIEIFQNCVIFNDGTFDDVAAKGVRDDRTIDLRPGEPMLYGKEHDKGLRLSEFHVEGCAADEAGVWVADSESCAPSMALAEIDRDPVLPTPIGILRKVDKPVFENQVHAQIGSVIESKGAGKLSDLVFAGDVWDVE